MRLTRVRRTQADPFAPHLIGVNGRIIARDVESERARRQPADGAQKRVGAHNAVALSGDEIDARIEQSQSRNRSEIGRAHV